MGKTILLLDEDKQFCKLIGPVLEGRGHILLQTESGQHGLEILKREKPDLVIVANELSDRSGVQWISDIRQDSNQVPCVFIGSSAKDVAINRSRLESEFGVGLCVHKPIIPFVFGAQIESSFSADNRSAQDAKLRDFESMYLALVQKYSKVLPGKLNDLALAITAAKSNPSDQTLGDQMRSQAHKIKGTSGSLGFARVSETMAFIEATAISIKGESEEERMLHFARIDQKLLEAQEAASAEALEVAHLVRRQGITHNAEIAPSMARILVVDSDTDFLDLVEDLGKDQQVEIVKASTYAEALDKACHSPLDAALVNVADDPEASFKLARELRELPGYDTLPLAFLSSETLSKDKVEASYAGASLYLDKPLESISLEKAVQHLVAIRQGGRPRVLIIDDDDYFANSIGLVLRNEGMIVLNLADPTKILDVMQEFPPDMLLLDVMMPGVTGFEVCRMLRTVPRWQDLPIIFLTGQAGVEARVEAFRCGGDDYLPKPVVNEELLTRVQVRLDRARLLKERSDKDTVTGLLLRRAFSEQLTGIIAETQRLKASFTICLLDLDHFKKVNDTYGHLAGDKVLAGMGQLLSRRFRVDDLRGRWGGEEFILAFRHETKETMHKAVTRVLQEFSQLTFMSDSGEHFHASFSGGLASFPEDGESVYELLQIADRRLYKAKAAGRNQVVRDDREPVNYQA